MGDDPDPDAAVQVLKRLGEGKEHIYKPEFVKSVIWCLQKLLQSGDDEFIEEAAKQFFQLYDGSVPLLQNQLLHGVFSQDSSFLAILLCNRSLAANSTFPRHLLLDSYFDVDFTARFTESYVMCKGMNSSFNLGVASNGEVVEPRTVPFREKIDKVSLSNTHTLFLSSSGTVFGCGQGAHGQLGPSMKKLVVEPTVIHLPTKGCPVIDLVACERYSVFLTQKSVLVCGEVSHSDIGSSREHPIRRFDLGEQDHLLYSVVASSDRVVVAANGTSDWLAGDWLPFRTAQGSRNSTFTQVDGNSPIQRFLEHQEFIFQRGLADLRGTAYLNFGLYSYKELREFQLMAKVENRRVVRLPWNRGGLTSVQALLKLTAHDSRCTSRYTIGYLRAVFDCVSLHSSDCLFSVNGTLVNLNVVQFDATKSGEVVVLGLSPREDEMADELSVHGAYPSVHRIPSQQHFAGLSLYRGRAVVVAEPQEKDDFVICSRDEREKAFYGLKILLELQEIPGTHSVRHFAMSPNGENVVYLVDNDEINVQNIPFVAQMVHLRPRHFRCGGAGLHDSLKNEFQRNWSALDIGYLNDARLSNGYQPLDFDLLVNDTLLPQERPSSIEECSFGTMQELAKTRFPQVEQFVTNGNLSVGKLTEKCGTCVTSLILHYLKGRDRFHPQELFHDYLGNIYQKQPAEKKEVCYKVHRKKYFDEIKRNLEAVGLTIREENYDTWRIRSVTVDQVVDKLEKDVELRTTDGVIHPYNSMVLTLQSQYFEAALSHMGDSLSLDFPSSVVEIALRVLIDPMYLYEIEYAQLFSLLDLFDKYILDAAVEDCLWVAFDRANEFNIHHLFESYVRLEHFRLAIADLFAHRMHLLCFWRGGSTAPLSLIQELASRLAPRETRFLSASGVGKGGGMVHANVLPFPPIYWSSISFPDVEKLLLGEAAGDTSVRQLDALYKKAEANRQMAFEERQTLPYPPPHFYELFEADAPPTLVRQLLKTKHARPRRVSEHLKDITAASPSSSAIPAAFEKLQEEFDHLDVDEKEKNGSAEAPDASDDPKAASEDAKEAEEEKLGEREVSVENGRRVSVEEPCSPASPPVNRWGVVPSTPPAATSSILRLEETPRKSTEKFISKGRRFHKVEVEKQQPKSSVAPWLAASTSSATSSPMSLRDIQKEEMATVKATPPREIPKTPRTRKNTWTEEPSPSPQQKPVSLSMIMADEEERNAPVVRIFRPLEFVETEERAVQELRSMYEQQYQDNAMITVEVVASTPSVSSRWDGHGPRR